MSETNFLTRTEHGIIRKFTFKSKANRMNKFKHQHN